MFVVIYRSFIKPQCEKTYEKAWGVVANYFIEHCGAIGSVLHKSQQGEYVAYSRWPTKEMRDAVWGDDTKPLPAAIEKAVNDLKSCFDLDKPHEEIELTMVNDLLLKETVANS